MNILVTGAGGFLGRNLSASLLSRGYKVWNFIRKNHSALQAYFIVQEQPIVLWDFIVRLKFQKLSELKFVSRTIPQSGGYNTPQLAAELFPKLALGFIPVIRRDSTFLD